MERRIVLIGGTHRDNDVVFLRFDRDEALIKLIRGKYEARWSASKKMWYVPASEFELNEFMKLMRGLAWMDYSGMRDKKLIAKAEQTAKSTRRNHSKFITDKETSYRIHIGKAT